MITQTEYGPYLPFRERLPQFIDEYPMKEGFAVTITVTDKVSCFPGLMSLYQRIVELKKDPSELLSPQSPFWRTLVFTARLIHDDCVLCTASTEQVVDNVKDYEVAETRARQRLVAACGFHGGLLDADEHLTGNRPISTAPSLPVDSTTTCHSLEDQQIDSESTAKVEMVDSGSIDEDSNVDSEPQSSLDDEVTADTVPIVIQTGIPAHLENAVSIRIAQLKSSGITHYEIPTNKHSALKFLRDTTPGVTS